MTTKYVAMRKSSKFEVFFFMVRNGWVSDPKWRSGDVGVKWFIYGRKADQAHLWDPFDFKKSISIVNRKSLTYAFENSILLMVTVWKVQKFETMFAISFWDQSSSTAKSDHHLEMDQVNVTATAVWGLHVGVIAAKRVPIKRSMMTCCLKLHLRVILGWLKPSMTRIGLPWFNRCAKRKVFQVMMLMVHWLKGMNTNPSGCVVWLAEVCSSFSAVNVGTSKRSATTPLGDTNLSYMNLGNLLLSRTILLILLATCLGRTWVVEQPGGSLLPFYPGWEETSAACGKFLFWR